MNEDKIIKEKLEHLKNYMYREIRHLKKKILHENLYEDELNSCWIADKCKEQERGQAEHIYHKHRKSYKRRYFKASFNRKYKRNTRKVCI